MKIIIDFGNIWEMLSAIGTVSAVIISLIGMYRSYSTQLNFLQGGNSYRENYFESIKDKKYYTKRTLIFVHNPRNFKNKFKLSKMFYKENNKERHIDKFVISINQERNNDYFDIDSYEYMEIFSIDWTEVDNLIGYNTLKESKIHFEFEDVKGKKYTLEAPVEEPGIL